MSKKHSEFVKKQFESEYSYYDNFIGKVVPGYEEMHKEVLKLLNFPRNKELRVLDLGIGTGKTAKAILNKFPNATIEGYDFSPKMISIAKESLKEYKNRVKFIIKDIKGITLSKKYDICVSVLAIHHLDPDEKQGLYKKIFNSLKNKGIFVNGDEIKQETKEEETKTLSKWKDSLVKSLGKKEGEEHFELFRKEDIPDKLSDNLQWLKDAGFKDVGHVWKHAIYAVFFAKK